MTTVPPHPVVVQGSLVLAFGLSVLSASLVLAMTRGTCPAKVWIAAGVFMAVITVAGAGPLWASEANERAPALVRGGAATYEWVTARAALDANDVHGGMWGMSWGLGMLVMIMFWGFVIAAIVWMFRSSESRAFQGGRRETPLDILQRRYASGDIGRDEYEQKRRDLGGETTRGEPPK